MKTPQEAEVNGLFNLLYFFLYKIAFYVVYLASAGMTDYYLILKTDKAEVNGLGGRNEAPRSKKGGGDARQRKGASPLLGFVSFVSS